LIAGAIINANIFGNMAVIIQELNKKASRFQEKIDTANTVMKNLKLPKELQKKVLDYLIYTQSNLDAQRELDKFKKMISPSLKMEVIRHIFSDIIKKNRVFREGSEDLIEFVLKRIHTYSFAPEALIVK